MTKFFLQWKHFIFFFVSGLKKIDVEAFSISFPLNFLREHQAFLSKLNKFITFHIYILKKKYACNFFHFVYMFYLFSLHFFFPFIVLC
jgi:hypothetical protein